MEIRERIMIKISYLKKVLEYRAGELFWRSGKRAGRIAGSITADGYKTINFRPNGDNGLDKRLFIRLHRVIFAMHHGRFPTGEIDHKNRDPLDNRIINLREATRSQQSMNTKIRKDNTTGVKGVRICSSSKSKNYQAFIYVDRKFRHLGLFVDLDEAAAVRRAAEVNFHGEFRAIVS